MSLIISLVGISLTYLVWLYWRWLQVKTYWSKLKVPHPAPHPILGNLTFLLKINAGIWMRQIYSEYKNPYVGIWLFWRPALVINSPEIARNILVKDSAVFRNRFLKCGDKDPIGNMNLFSYKDPMWSKARRHLTVILSAAKLRAIDDFVMSKCIELKQRISNDMGKRKELKDLYIDFTTDVIGTTAFGVSCNATMTGKDPIRTIAGELSEYNIIRGISWCCIFFIPELVDVLRLKFLPDSAICKLRGIVKMVVAAREANSDNVGGKTDLIDTLLKLNKMDDKLYSEDFIIAQAASFLIGGFDTTASVLAFVTYELAYYPEIQEKLYQELQEAQQKHGSDNFDSNILLELTYLNCVIKEGLRKYSPMSWFDRVAAFDYKIDDKLTIKAGTPVYVNGIGIHYDPEYYPDPDRFDPDRFLPENEVNIKPYTYMPFGEGPRTCIGYRFAMMTLRCAVASVFLKYKVEPYCDGPKPIEIKISNRGMFYMPGESLYVKFVNRV